MWTGHRKQGLPDRGAIAKTFLARRAAASRVARPQAEIRLQRFGCTEPGMRAPKDEALLAMPSSPVRRARDRRRSETDSRALARSGQGESPRRPAGDLGSPRTRGFRPCSVAIEGRAPRPVPATATTLLARSDDACGQALHLEADVSGQRPDWMDPSMHRAPNDEPISSANGSVATWPCFRWPHRSVGQPRNLAAARDPPGKEEGGGTDGAPRRPA